MIRFLKRLNLPNRLTLLRVALVPVFCAFLCVNAAWGQLAAVALFLAASLTDMLDGRIARSRGLITDFGKLMDPIADKLLVTAAMVFLVAQLRMSAGVCLVFIAREFVISGFRMIAAARGVVIAAGLLGKYKTVTQMAAVVMSIIFLPFDGQEALISLPAMEVMTNIVMWIALALAVISCVDYIRRNKDVIDTSNM